jgi:hypothetical protein
LPGIQDGTGQNYKINDSFPVPNADVILYAKWIEPKLGDIGPAGGFIFYDKGVFTDGWRYLESAPSDQSTGIKWNNNEISYTNDSNVGFGESNTISIVAASGLGNYAASICKDLVINGYDDWFLPSKMELYYLYKNLVDSGSTVFGANWYWSSTEDDHYSTAWAKNFTTYTLDFAIYGKGGTPSFEKNFLGGVRAIRSF